jgi:hypothetical protein
MSPNEIKPGCDQRELVALDALRVLRHEESRAMQSHIATCSECQRELQSLRPVVESFASWPTDLLRPTESLWDRLAHRVADERCRTVTLHHARASGTGVGRSSARYLLQTTCHGHGKASRQHVGSTRAWNRLSTAHPRGRGGVASARGRALDR